MDVAVDSNVLSSASLAALLACAPGLELSPHDEVEAHLP